MERLSTGLRKGGGGLGKAAAPPKRSTAAAKGKFKLRASKDPWSLLTKKDSGRQTKPKARFLASTGAGIPKEAQGKVKPSIFAANSFLRPPAADGPPKKQTGFSFMKFQPKASEAGKLTSDFSAKVAPLVFASTKPLLTKFSVNGLAKKSTTASNEGTTRMEKVSLFKPPAKGLQPFAFRAETKSSAAKKRKAAESFANKEKWNAFPSKSARVKTTASFSLENSAPSKEEKEADNQLGAFGENAQRGSIRRRPSFAAKVGSLGVKMNDGVVLKKRSLLLPFTEAGPVPKKIKCMKQMARQQREGTANEAIESRAPRGMLHGEGIAGLPTSAAFHSVPTSPDFPPAATMSVQPCAVTPPSIDRREECLSGIEEELAMKLLCTLDNDQEDEFLNRAAVIQDSTDRVGLEQKQTRDRLLDAHADVSECLLDALTDLMAEEGGIGIDKLAFDMNIDVDVDDAFLQDDEIQVLQ